MADETPQDNLEKKVDGYNPANLHPTAPSAEHKEEKKTATPLESLVNETSHGIGSAFKLGVAAAIPAASGLAFPYFARDTALLAASQIAGDATTDRRRGKKYTAGNALESAIIGTALAPPLTGLFEAVHKIPLTSPWGYLGQAAAWGGLAYPAYFGLYQFVNYVVRNKTVKGVGKYIKQHYWPALKHAWKTLFPFSVVNLLFAPAYLNIPIAAGLSYLLTLFGAPKTDQVKEKDKRDPTPYYIAAPTVAAKLVRNSVKGLYDAVYAIGSSISDLYKTAPKTAAPSQPAPAGAHP